MKDIQEIDDNLEGLHGLFHLKIDTMVLYTKEVESICSGALNASNIRHPPITSRIKSWESAKGSIYRRHQERLVRSRLYDAVKAQGRRWEDYTRESGLSPEGYDMEPFKSPEDMLAALHDFGGIRISLYFPGDLERVAAIIEKRFDIIRRIEKGHGSQVNVQGLEERLELFQNSERTTQTTANSKELQRSMRTFTGYKATHFVVKLRDQDIPPARKYGWKDVITEIQVGTLVMHVWSEIEHDMIYKPLDSQGEKVSEDEERILDLINGIVLTGEAALRQLEASTSKRLSQRAENKDIMASSHYELATWIEKDCEERGTVLQGAEWRLLEQLFTILKTTGDHRHSDVTNMIEDATRQTSSRHSLPGEMLQALCKRPICPVWQQFNESTLISVIQNARLWALRLVHSLNLAMYFGILEEFLGVTNLPLRRPSIASFLEILHPDQPGCSSPETAESITNCCRAILDPKHRLKNPSNDLIKVAINLPVTNMVACCADSGSLFPIPAIISRLLPIDDDTNKKSGSDTEKPYRVIDFIEFYLSNVNNRDHKIVLWDHLTSQSGDREHRRPIEDRFFVPISEPLSGIMAPCRWQLTDRGVQLNLQKMDPDDIGKAAKAIPGGYPAIRSSIPKVDAELELAYHLYPREQWAGVRTAWGMARALRSQPEVEIIPSSKRKSVRHKSANARTSHTPTGAISSKIHENLDSGNHKYD
jgi:ppGpp synthetase/RelA/SpoT-type nucleotidyltranferase